MCAWRTTGLSKVSWSGDTGFSLKLSAQEAVAPDVYGVRDRLPLARCDNDIQKLST